MTANAKAHTELLRSGWRDKDVSWHYSVDDHSIYRSIPEDEVAWHAGDGSQGTGNNETVAIETCVNDGNNYDLTLAHAADLAADILFRHGAKTVEDHLFQHADWYKKDCPHVIRSKGLWDPFCEAVQLRLTALWAPPEPEPYTIQPGDTFWGIARKLNIPLKDILDANAGVDPYNLHVGQVILLPGADVYVVHTIKAGDMFWGLSRYYGRPVSEIMMANPGVDPYQLQNGQKIRIPQ